MGGGGGEVLLLLLLYPRVVGPDHDPARLLVVVVIELVEFVPLSPRALVVPEQFGDRRPSC